jgi:hypothetical protein
MSRRKRDVTTEVVESSLEPAANPLPVLSERVGEQTVQRVRLLKPHRHAGQTHPSGVVLEVNRATAGWLIERGVATDESGDGHDAE